MYRLFIFNLGTGQNCTRAQNYTKTNLHQVSILHKGTFLYENKKKLLKTEKKKQNINSKKATDQWLELGVTVIVKI